MNHNAPLGTCSGISLQEFAFNTCLCKKFVIKQSKTQHIFYKCYKTDKLTIPICFFKHYTSFLSMSLQSILISPAIALSLSLILLHTRIDGLALVFGDKGVFVVAELLSLS